MRPIRKREQASLSRFHRLTLDDFFASLKLSSEEDQKNYLISLKEITADLWKSYRQKNISVDYSDPKIQEAYFLRYCHMYYSTIYDLLDEIREDFVADTHNEMLQFTFVCSGPGSEAIGLVDWIESNFPLFFDRYNEINLVDDYLWGVPRKITHQTIEKILFERNFQGRVEFNDINCNVLNTQWIEKIDDSNQKIIVIQNAVNEILSQDSSGESLDWLIEKLLKTLKETGLLIITDRAGYGRTNDYLSRLEEKLSVKGFNQLIAMENIENVNQRKSKNCPRILKYLFDGQAGRIFSKNNEVVAKIFAKA